MELDKLKQYLRIDEDDDELLEMFQGMAKEYIKNAVKDVDDESKLYELTEALLVSHWYENREVARIGNNAYSIPHSFEGIIQQLRYAGDKE